MLNAANDDCSQHKCMHCNNTGSSILLSYWQKTAYVGAERSWTRWRLYYCKTCYNITLEEDKNSSWQFEKIMNNGTFILENRNKHLYPEIIDLDIKNESTHIVGDMLVDYEEAKKIAVISPRSAAALLRLLLEKMCAYYLKSTDNLNNMIKVLIEKGIPENIEKACDIVRIIGNETVHPGTLDIRDNPQIVSELFVLINTLADYLYLHCERVSELHSILPPEKLKGIEIRDKAIAASKQNKGV